MAATLRTLLFSIPAVLAMGALRVPSDTAVIQSGVHPSRFWVEKASIRREADVALGGDSRVYHGLSPSETLVAVGARYSGKVLNLGFSGVCLCGPYLAYLDDALASPILGRQRAIVLGVTPHSLTSHAAKDNGYLAESGRSISEKLERRYLARGVDFLEPIPVEDLWRRAMGGGPPRPEHVYSERFFADGWVAASLDPPMPDHALKEYSTVLGSSKVEPSIVDALLVATSRWSAANVVVVAFRPPVSPAVRRLEDELGGYDESDFRRRFTASGGKYFPIDDPAYETYDGSHLGETNARKLSRDVGARLGALLSP